MAIVLIALVSALAGFIVAIALTTHELDFVIAPRKRKLVGRDARGRFVHLR